LEKSMRTSLGRIWAQWQALGEAVRVGATHYQHLTSPQIAVAPQANDATLQFPANYRERLVLKRGGVVFLRLIHPSDKPHLEAGLRTLSPLSRYHRFHGERERLTEAELRYLTEVDQWNHFAFIAYRRQKLLRQGVGVARFVRLRDTPQEAEAAIVVADAYQGAGLGTQMLQRLIDAAHERQIEQLRFEVLSSNTAASNLLVSRLGARLVERGEGIVVLQVQTAEPSDGA
jgi:acetyltransferase